MTFFTAISLACMWSCFLATLPVYAHAKSVLGTALPTASPRFVESEVGVDCALLFFGAPRGLNTHGFSSIQRNILQTNPTCHIYAHTFNFSEVDSRKRNNTSHNAEVDPNDVFLFGAGASLTPRKEFDKVVQLLLPFGGATLLSLAFTRDRYETKEDHNLRIRNLLRAYLSLEILWAGLPTPNPYHWVGIFRMDLEYKTPINIRGSEAVLPAWGYYGGVNDRGFYGKADYAHVWATGRLLRAWQAPYCGQTWRNSEQFLRDHLKEGCVLHRIKFATSAEWCMERTRSDGHVQHGDCDTRHLRGAAKYNFTFNSNCPASTHGRMYCEFLKMNLSQRRALYAQGCLNRMVGKEGNYRLDETVSTDTRIASHAPLKEYLATNKGLRSWCLFACWSSCQGCLAKCARK